MKIKGYDDKCCQQVRTNVGHLYKSTHAIRPVNIPPKHVRGEFVESHPTKPENV